MRNPTVVGRDRYEFEQRRMQAGQLLENGHRQPEVARNGRS